VMAFFKKKYVIDFEPEPLRDCRKREGSQGFCTDHEKMDAFYCTVPVHYSGNPRVGGKKFVFSVDFTGISA